MTKPQLLRYENRREEIKLLLGQVDTKLRAMLEILEASDPANAPEVEIEANARMYLEAVSGTVSGAELLMIDARIETYKRLKEPS